MARPFTTTLLIPTLNEIDGMRAVVPRICREWVDQVLIIDGGSTDGTVQFARESNFDVCVQSRPGMRGAYLDALPMVRGEVVLTFSPDGNSVPELIPAVLDKIAEGFDLVIASRYLPPARSEDDDFVTRFGNWFFTKTVNFLTGARYTDVMVMFRAYRVRLIRELELDEERWYRTPELIFRCSGVSWEPMLSFRAARRKLKIGEIPGDEPARIGGVRKLRAFQWGGVCYFEFLRDFLLWK